MTPVPAEALAEHSHPGHSPRGDHIAARGAATPERARQVNVHGTHNMLAPAADVPAVFQHLSLSMAPPASSPCMKGCPAQGVYAQMQTEGDAPMHAW